ncbi:putative mitochondrial protein [Vitis vinifera]|uniref:Putative mitochondrial protein n=1 Tax=Vitis vinifera TaxID=29760 RepID=A0A438H1D9_VITVI|nr:putative mitochondrial protein [Vitis vinifera]
MRGCLSMVSYAILVNGNAKGWVKATRGLRQGDPLSHFLFTIIADVLSKMLLRVEERGLLEGFKVNLDKSNLFGINLDQNHFSRLAELLDCKASDWPILYLGLPLGGNPRACGFRIQ